MAATKPAVVIVPGAFYEPWHYRLLHTGLEQAGYNVTTVTLPSTGGDKAQPNADADIAATASAIKSYISAGQDVVVAMHSYGGFVGNCAPKGLLPADTENGKGVVGMVHICAGAPLEGMSMMDATGGTNFPWAILIGDDPKPNTGIFMFCKDPGDLFFHDCEPEVREEAVQRLRYWSEGCMWSKATFAAQTHVESHFLMCTEDHGMPPAMQEMITQMPGGKWKFVEKIATSHSPFLSRPEETVRFVRKCCGEDL